MSVSGIQGLINFWSTFKPAGKKPCVHEGDLEVIPSSMKKELEAMKKKEATAFLTEMSSVSNFFKLTSPNQDGYFHLSLSPVPYLGNLRSADIFLLMLNPKAGYVDYCTNADPEFQLLLARTLKQEEGEKVCLALDPEYCRWSSWFGYYEKLFRATLLEHAIRAGSYGEALKALSRRLAILELVPYFSANTSRIKPAFLDGLPSAQKARDAALELCKRAKKPGIVRLKSRNEFKSGQRVIVDRLKSQHNPVDPIVII
jgi:hypothetical protein